jgi:acyl carrier protein
MSTTIGEAVRAFVFEAFYPAADLGDGASLGDSGTMDSTGVIELLDFVERRFEIAVDEREIHADNLDSIARITAFVERKLAERRAAAAAPPPPAPRAREAGAEAAPPSVGDPS